MDSFWSVFGPQKFININAKFDVEKNMKFHEKNLKKGAQINAKTHQKSMPKLVTKRIRKIIKNHVSLKGKIIEIH